jgi:hypothetical protein
MKEFECCASCHQFQAEISPEFTNGRKQIIKDFSFKRYFWVLLVKE